MPKTNTPTPETTVTEELSNAVQAQRKLVLQPSCKPSKELEYTTIQAIGILMSSGTIHYVTEYNGKDINGHEKWISYAGDKVTLNTNHIVQKTEVELIHTTTDITEHANRDGTHAYKRVIRHTIHSAPRGIKVFIQTGGFNAREDQQPQSVIVLSWKEIFE